MSQSRDQSIERKIGRLKRELEDWDNYFYQADEVTDRALHSGMLERKRDDIVRGAVLQVHTAIEDVLTSLIISKILGVRPGVRLKPMRTGLGRALGKMLVGPRAIGFDLKGKVAVDLGICNSQTAKSLTRLNELRNKCSHNWLLKRTVRLGKKPKEKKPPLLLYRDRDLHNINVLKEFYDEFGALYVRLVNRLLV